MASVSIRVYCWETMTTTPLLQLESLTRSFPGIVASNQIDLTVGQGTIHALLGENGAGKSTLVKMIYGALRPDGGRMWFDGRPYAPANPAAARATGVGMVSSISPCSRR